MAARQQMAFTLGFHIVLACLGVSFPAIALIANYRGIRHGDAEAMLLARRWAKAMAVLFAVGAVTGTLLSFELGLLWPGLFEQFGDAFGLPFGYEGLFFFTEAIFIAIYIYGFDRLSPWKHFLSGIPIVLAGIGGTFSVVAANAWMNQPGGFEIGADGRLSEVNLFGVLFNDGVWHQVPHMLLAAYIVSGFGVASVYAFAMLKGRRDRYHKVGLLIPLTVAAIAMPLQMFVGDFAARQVFDNQPVKFAAMEMVPTTSTDVPEILLGRYVDGEVEGGIRIPGLASLLSGFSTDTEIQGLDTVPPEDRPPVTIVHWAFDVMVGIGTALFGLAVWFGFVWWRKRRIPNTDWFLRAVAVSGIAAVVATWAGWVVTEVGRQPWVVYGYLRTEDAVTSQGGLWYWFAGIVGIYTLLGVTAVVVLRRMARRWREEAAVGSPYGPDVHDEKTPEGAS
ncbi:cytochrome ubiquinol oxidase subunit I [Rhabdothermincola salaria]|uniref:cytochrome ubiquinol oxidase subunit I n=1 Tax=Rhabdothermincola salaria TaxID=2903142 RepID=UPI001E29AF52|nr:cytochrome ubiquinol oxidase subunit I [Rhabdothermincola salaria]MCD9622916.1 cytochrome ubiquinol oxidase subunit I [Rhabdothermincola salaria]